MPLTAASAREGWLPRTLLDLLQRGVVAAAPAGDTVDAVVLLADVSGFTALTERLAESGTDGAEKLSEILNARFSGLIEMLVHHGGDITHFAGDAIVAIWRLAPAGSLAQAVRQAATCALALQALPAAASDGAAALPLRAGVCVGSAWWALLGAEEEHTFVFGGVPVVAAAAAAAAGQPGEVVISAAAWSLLQPWASGEPLVRADGASPSTVDHYRLRALEPQAVADDPATAAAPLATPPDRLLPRNLRSRLAMAGEWLAEFRRVTVMFVSFGEVDFAAPWQLARAQSALCEAQAIAARFDGVMHQLVADGPGATLIAAWGLPSVTHEDDARRGVTAALALDAALRRIGLAPAIGVTTGRAFCGVRGSPQRREWAILGDRMNLAARLMRAAGQGILCDEGTQLAARGRVAFDPQPAIRVKGKSRPVTVFRPRETGVEAAMVDPGHSRLVGREAELGRIAERLDAFAGGSEGGVLLLEGEAGIGKSTLLREMESLATARGIAVLRAEADAIENATAYFVWRTLLRQLVGSRRGDAAAAIRERVLAALADDAALVERAPLLGDVLTLDLPDSAVTAPMESLGRADALRDLVAAMLRRRARQGPLLVMLDDAHWFDSASWALTAAAARRAPQVTFVIATRTLAPPLPAALQQLLSGGAERLALLPLSLRETLDLVCRRLGVDRLPTEAESLIAEKAQGNPFFSEQLALALCDAGLLLIEGRHCRLDPPGRDLVALGVPDTVQGVVAGRLDRLASGEQMTLKVASAIGRSFGFRVLRDVYPEAPKPAALRGHLDHLTEVDLTRLEAPEPELSHLFTHIITQQVAYELMSFAQRRALHRAIAGWFETRFGDDLNPYLQLLAHHWANADDAGRALAYLERAAVQALERFANEEVLRFMAEGRALAERGRLAIDNSRRSRWELCEGEALLKLARYSESRSHFLASLRLLGRPVSASRAGLAGSIALESVRQGWRRWTGSAARAQIVADDQRAGLLQAVHLHQRLAEVGYWEHDFLLLVHCAVVSLNLAEPAGVSRELQLAQQVMGFVAGLAGSARLFDGYRRRADMVASQVDHVETTAFCAQLDAIYFNGQARWCEMDAAARRAGALFERIGERFRWQTCVVLRAWGTLHQGDVGAARTLFEEAERLVQAEGPTQVQVWCSAGLLAAEMAQRGVGDARRVKELERLLARGVDHSDGILCRGLLALAHHRAGARELALAHAERATALIDKLPPGSFHTLLGNAAVAELRLCEWQRSSGRPARAAARHAIRGLWLFAMSCPIGLPSLWRARAGFARLDGRPKRAQRCWERARAESARLGMREPEPT